MTAPDSVYFEKLEELSGNPFPLGRNVKHDPQSRNFAFVETVVPALSLNIEVEWEVAIRPLRQVIGCCTGCAGTADEATTNEQAGGVVADPLTHEPLDLDYAVALYSAATKVDPFQGEYPPEDTGSDGLSIAKVLKARGLISKYTHIFGIEDAKVAIQHGSFITGTVWTTDMFRPDSHGIVTAGGQNAGGHEYLVIGRKQYFKHLGEITWFWKCRNSWGSDFGDGGDFYMSDATYDFLLRQRGDATVLHWLRETVQPEPPGPPPFSIRTWLRELIVRLLDVVFRRGRT